ncbi:hypothetical protein L596_011000 [Steinernema carpocapsae]|uniref:Uncharacterized protein n=1 Tax=Steinernema carpocapsae TaxID=34508 RepID=A0A4U5NRH8_STECR|nr:hypothetical protein L596_011000 [Steinernema carpocapsae]
MDGANRQKLCETLRAEGLRLGPDGAESGQERGLLVPERDDARLKNLTVSRTGSSQLWFLSTAEHTCLIQALNTIT